MFFVPIDENKHNVNPRYYETIEANLKDEITRRRLLGGEWIDRPSGDAIFFGYFHEASHIRGDRVKETGIIPLAGIPIVTGWDPGPKNFCIEFMQMIPSTKGELLWTIFDELNYVGKYAPDYRVVADFLAKVEFWKSVVGSESPYFNISDEVGWTQLRNDGSYDVRKIQELSKGKIRLRPCPKAKDSVRARVQMTMNKLMSDLILVSALCPKTIDMFLYLNSVRGNPEDYDENRGLKPMRSPQLHPFDAMTYGMYYFDLNPALVIARAQKLEAKVYAAGG